MNSFGAECRYVMNIKWSLECTTKKESWKLNFENFLIIEMSSFIDIDSIYLAFCLRFTSLSIRLMSAAHRSYNSFLDSR